MCCNYGYEFEGKKILRGVKETMQSLRELFGNDKEFGDFTKREGTFVA